MGGSAGVFEMHFATPAAARLSPPNAAAAAAPQTTPPPLPPPQKKLHAALAKTRRPFERLLRSLLSLPRRPAVVLVHSYMWARSDAPYGRPGTYYSSAERELSELASYYGLPSVSVRGAAFHAMRAGEPCFQVRV